MLQEEWIMTMKPLADRVLIKVEKEEEKTVGGLVLATKNPAGVPAKGKVVACGEGKFSPNGTRVPMEVKVGDTVLISHSAGQTVKLDGEELTLVYESEILGITE
ncbi:chaperonin GroS [Ruminococcus callidus ATCC 27760]|jgi:chaperonin GroES|uniref:Co-chaperonin GroES n=3 Tax=Oscillospiraceae TaxID=216572 RepID=U2KG01_9FIRM|nr:chaperonin GroS [Ruminococcus callidus ATCC 27760]